MAAKGKTMQNEERKVGEPIEATANEFAPNAIPGAGLVAPAPSPEPGVLAQKGDPANLEVVEEINAADAAEVVEDREFVSYVNGELNDIAASLGYEIVLKKKADPNADFAGPTMLYNEAGEGRVFKSKADVPVGYMTMDELNARRAAKAE